MRDIGHFIGGKDVQGTSGRSGDVFNPNTGEVQAKVALASRTEVEQAIANAQGAQHAWAATNPQRRARVLFKFLELVQKEYDSLANMLSSEHGKTVPDAKVTVAVKDRGGVVTRTDALGAYKVPGFGKEISPDDVAVTCEKQGYKQNRTLRRPLPPPDSKIPVETDCFMQRA